MNPHKIGQISYNEALNRGQVRTNFSLNDHVIVKSSLYGSALYEGALYEGALSYTEVCSTRA